MQEQWVRSGLNERQGQCHMQNNCPLIQIRERSAGPGFSNRSIHAGVIPESPPFTPSNIVAYRRRVTKEKWTNPEV